MDEIVIYRTEDNQAQIEVRFDNDTVWLSLNQIAALFERDKSVISRHLQNVFREGELEETATVAKNATVQNEGLREITRDIEFYNLDAIISIGYRVNSKPEEMETVKRVVVSILNRGSGAEPIEKLDR